jgi:four helix bundle protein
MLQDFRVFKLASEFYTGCKMVTVPRFLKDQLQRASASIALNIAEGSGKTSPADQRRFYSMAFGSLRECQAIFELEKINDPQLIDQANRLGGMLYKLTRMSLPRRDSASTQSTKTGPKTEHQTTNRRLN